MKPEDEDDMYEVAAHILSNTKSRGDIKKFAKLAESLNNPDLRSALIIQGRQRGANLPEEAAGWSYKRLIRVARGNEADSRVRRNPIALDEGFQCEHCLALVTAHGRTARNHCPHCLYSKHVDVVPGDRQSNCRGLMPAVEVQIQNGTVYLLHKCELCGHKRRNKAILDGEMPDDWTLISALSNRGARG